MVLGVLLALSSAFQFNSVWVYGEYEYGDYIITWDDSVLVLWPTYFLSQIIGIDLVGGGLLLFHYGIESSYLRIGKKLVFLIGCSIIIYYFLGAGASGFPQLVAGAVALLLSVVTFDTTNHADRIRDWFGGL